MSINGSYENEYKTSLSYWGDKPSSAIEKYKDVFVQGTVLDIGAGDGRNTLYLAQTGFTVNALDLSKTGLKNLMTKAERAGTASLISTTVADFVTYTPDKQYDNVITNFTIHFIGSTNIMPFIAKMMHATKPGGINLIDDFTQNGPLAKSISENYLTQALLISLYNDAGWTILSTELRAVKTRAEEMPGKPYNHEAISFIAKKPAL